jgi:hypothetical protein
MIDDKLTIKLDSGELPLLRARLQQHGYHTLEDLVKDFATGKFPLSSDDYRDKIQRLLKIQGDAGCLVKMAMFSGFDQSELVYAYSQQVCQNPACECKKLHVIDRPSGISLIIVNWRHDGRVCYLAVLPTVLWRRFRSLPRVNLDDLAFASRVAKEIAGVSIDQLRLLYCDVLSPWLDSAFMQVLTGRASPSAVEAVTERMDSVIEQYCRAWAKFGVVLSYRC